MLPPTVTVPIRTALRQALDRAHRTGRTQQIELGDNLFIRIAGQGRRFLLFQLDGEPDQDTARAIAEALGFRRPEYGWHQGATLRSLTVVDADSDPPAP
ncbi:hypothetical protein [Deinococcus maricopensis]|uniref:Uncharacterized protein n=1 Tax=Deinococcus maricopensis (strain DSM 21211 / LMG 22137 / NRRL B-23946 / LB-34) TaxID=709986 RepID=E8U6Q7_DEIML|nr:hypothetical protein [Deinococcus maricopensis]ADV66746.1 hypothetical protein Deima_1093 [Deinococcus maricopensis DSM 21211]